MLIEHFIVARDSSIDRETNTMSVFGLVEDIEIRGPEALQIQTLPLQGIVVFRRENERGALNLNATFRIFGPNNAELLNQNLPVPMHQNHRRSRIRFNFPLAVQNVGQYRFVLAYDGQQREIEVNVGRRN